jgi:uncharacterized protein
MRIVCDTHILLEWLVWNSPKLDALRTAQRSGQIELCYSADMLLEWRAVLNYPHIKSSKFANYTDADIDSLCEAFCALQTLVAIDPAQVATLPRCADRNDQKLLECAVCANASALLTRDKKVRKILRHRFFKALGMVAADIDIACELPVEA